MIVNARFRLWPPLPVGYVGNTIFRKLVEATAGEVLEFGAMAKTDVATKRIDDEFVKSLVDYLEQKVNEVGLRKGRWVMPKTDLWVISWMGLPIYDADFGWWKPFYMGRDSLQFGRLVYIVPSSPEEEGGVFVMLVTEENVGRFKEVFFDEHECIGSARF